MGDHPPQEPTTGTEVIPPPKDLPDFFKQERVSPIVPPLPPQLHPLPQPKIVVAPPTPCPMTSPPLGPCPPFSMPEPVAGSQPAEVDPSSMEFSSKSSEGDAFAYNKNQAAKPVSIRLAETENQLDKLEEAEAEETGVLGWLQKRVNNSSFLSKVADKAKNSMDSVLTTLDPGMKDFLKRDGGLDIVIASDNPRLVTAISDGFRRVFLTLTHHGVGTSGAGHLQSQIVGHSMALKYMNERITLVRSNGLALPKSAVVVVQPFLHEIEGEWYESAVIGVQKNTEILHVFTQPVQVESAVVAALRNRTPKDYAPNAFAVTVGNAYAEVFNVDADDWQLARFAVSSSENYKLASTMLANAFKQKFSFVLS